MATCNECRKQVRGVLHADMETPTVVGDATSGGGLVAVDVYLRLTCPQCGAEIASRVMELEELFEHSCRSEEYLLQDARVRPSDQTIIRPDKRSSRRWLGADITIALQCPRCSGEIKVCVTVGDYALEFIKGDTESIQSLTESEQPMSMLA